MVYYPYRGEPMVCRAMEMVKEGVIGDVVRVFCSGPHKLNAQDRPSWHFTKRGNGGALVDIGSHHVDMCCYVAGEWPRKVSGLHVNRSKPIEAIDAKNGHDGEFQDFAQMMLQFDSGVLGHVEVDWLQCDSIKSFGDTRFWIGGTKGKIELRFKGNVTGELWTDEKAGEAIDVSGREGLAAWDKRLMEDLVWGRETVIAQEDIWRASAVSLAGLQSAEAEGEWVELAGRAFWGE